MAVNPDRDPRIDRRPTDDGFAADLFTGLNVVMFLALMGCVVAAVMLYAQGL